MTQIRPTQVPDDSATAVAAPLPVPGFVAKTAVADALPAAEAEPTHLLHFEPLSAAGAGLDVPCDPKGCVRLDMLGDKLRNDYFFARTLIGRLFARPTVRSAMPLMHV